MSTPHTVPLLYFGKLPSRGDFVRSAHAPVLIQTLDRWLTGGVEQLAADPRWKLLYDRAVPVDFAFLGSRSPRGMAGHLIASSDVSGRRFPFIAACLIETGLPAEFLARSPLLLARPWQQFQAAVLQARSAEDATPMLADLGQAQVEVPTDPRLAEPACREFLHGHSIEAMESLLTAAGHEVSLRSLMLGLGLLLQPVPASGMQRLDKGLRLPLPQDPLYRPLVASFWLDLVGGFLGRADFELALFLPHAPAGSAPVMYLGFDGASPAALRALLDPDDAGSVFIDACQADWVEDYVEQDYAVKKLSSYLLQPGLSLHLAAETFKECFLGY
jgi:type VI secretion system protein ImpM